MPDKKIEQMKGRTLESDDVTQNLIAIVTPAFLKKMQNAIDTAAEGDNDSEDLEIALDTLQQQCGSLIEAIAPLGFCPLCSQRVISTDVDDQPADAMCSARHVFPISSIVYCFSFDSND